MPLLTFARDVACTRFVMAFGYYGAIMIITRVFEDDRHTDETGNPVFNFRSIMISSSAEFLGLTTVILTVERIGRIRPQAFCLILGGILSLILSILASSGSVTVLTVVSFFTRSVEMGASCLLWVTTAESLATEIRATGEQVCLCLLRMIKLCVHCSIMNIVYYEIHFDLVLQNYGIIKGHSAANAIARIGGFLCPFLIQENIPFWAIGSTMCTLHFISAFCVSRLPETKSLDLGKIPHDLGSIAKYGRLQQET